MIEHHIQRAILNRLMFSEQLRFSELKPKGMESNIFMYHLRLLIMQGYVVKPGRGYTLAPLGLHYVDGLSNTNLKPRTQPKLIAILAVENPNNEWLLARRKFQPYINRSMFPSGKQHLGETIAEHAARESKEKLGTKLKLTYRGVAEIVISKNGVLLTHVVAHVHYSRSDLALPPAEQRFDYFWNDFNGAEPDLMPATKELYRTLMDRQDNFMASWKIDL